MRVAPRLRAWLTGRQADPSIRFRYLTEVERRAPGDPKVRAARRQIGKKGWASYVLENQFKDGHWVTPGTTPRELYRPKYVVTNWRAIVLGELGMDRSDARVRRAAEILLDEWTEHGKDPNGLNDEVCVTGNAVRTFVRFGYLDHPAVQNAITWLVKTQKSDGGWHCWPSRSGTLDCWEALAAFSVIPPARRTDAVRASIARGAEFYLERRLAREGRTEYAPWRRIHYPNHYYYDLLVGLQVLTRLGYGQDARLRPALRWLHSKRRTDGTWQLDADHPDVVPGPKSYAPTGAIFPLRLEYPGQPSQWATVAALSVLTATEAD